MKRFAPAAERNERPIGDVLAQVLPETGFALEVASGTGQHAAAFAARFPALTWQPSERDADALISIAAWAADAGCANSLPPLVLDVTDDSWPVTRADAVVCINMIHIAPWGVCEALLRGAGRILAPSGLLFLYGPFRLSDRPTAASNEAFDRALRSRNPAWGLRHADEVARAAAGSGLDRERVYDMPANNVSIVFRKRDTTTKSATQQ